MAEMRIGLVGCGNIASDVCQFVIEKNIPARIVALSDILPAQAELLRQHYSLNAIIGTVEEVAANADFVVECAATSAVLDVVRYAITYQKDCLIMSVGGLLEHPEAFGWAKQGNIKIWVPSGAVCGLDGLRVAAYGGIDDVLLTTTKPPKALKGAPYITERKIELDHLEGPIVVFEGTAVEAVKAFPANINVAAAVSLAGVGPEKTRVKIVADPTTTVNSHEIRARGAFGELCAVMKNRPSPRNPKSSYMASLSACAEVAAAAAMFAAKAG